MNARNWRRRLLIGALTCWGFFIVWLLLPLLGKATPGFAVWGMRGTPLALWLGDTEKPAQAVVSNLGFLGLLLLAQWAFLRPLRRTALHGAEAGRPRGTAAVAVGFVAALLSVAAIATVLEIPRWWDPMLDKMSHPRLAIWLALGAIWLGWGGVFYVYFRQGDFWAKAEATVRGLIRGSVLELLVAIPTHALHYRRGNDDCYCARGSYTGLVFGAGVLLWAFGPGLFLLFWRERRRREPVLNRLCVKCGALLDPAAGPGQPCPQCGKVTAGDATGGAA